jgi:hypothetical protein
MEDMQPIDLNGACPDTNAFERNIENLSLNYPGTDSRILAIDDSELDKRTGRSTNGLTTLLGSPEFLEKLTHFVPPPSRRLFEW